MKAESPDRLVMKGRITKKLREVNLELGMISGAVSSVALLDIDTFESCQLSASQCVQKVEPTCNPVRVTIKTCKKIVAETMIGDSSMGTTAGVSVVGISLEQRDVHANEVKKASVLLCFDHRDSLVNEIAYSLKGVLTDPIPSVGFLLGRAGEDSVEPNSRSRK